jgi:hypothetical protein
LRHIFQGGELSKSPVGASESTLRRWRDEYQPKLQEWAGRLEALIMGQRPTPGLIGLTFDPLARLEEVLSGLPPLPSDWSLMIKTLWWLTKSHPL